MDEKNHWLNEILGNNPKVDRLDFNPKSWEHHDQIRLNNPLGPFAQLKCNNPIDMNHPLWVEWFIREMGIKY